MSWLKKTVKKAGKLTKKVVKPISKLAKTAGAVVSIVPGVGTAVGAGLAAVGAVGTKLSESKVGQIASKVKESGVVSVEGVKKAYKEEGIQAPLNEIKQTAVEIRQVVQKEVGSAGTVEIVQTLGESKAKKKENAPTGADNSKVLLIVGGLAAVVGVFYFLNKKR